LRPDGTCDKTEVSWDNISLSIRQLLRIALTETREISSIENDKVCDLIDLVKAKTEKELKKRYPKASLVLAEKLNLGQAPILKVALGKLSQCSNDPFFSSSTGHKRF
jgi:hypothetical protein